LEILFGIKAKCILLVMVRGQNLGDCHALIMGKMVGLSELNVGRFGNQVILLVVLSLDIDFIWDIGIGFGLMKELNRGCLGVISGLNKVL